MNEQRGSDRLGSAGQRAREHTREEQDLANAMGGPGAKARQQSQDFFASAGFSDDSESVEHPSHHREHSLQDLLETPSHLGRRERDSSRSAADRTGSATSSSRQPPLWAVDDEQAALQEVDPLTRGCHIPRGARPAHYRGAGFSRDGAGRASESGGDRPLKHLQQDDFSLTLADVEDDEDNIGGGGDVGAGERESGLPVQSSAREQQHAEIVQEADRAFELQTRQQGRRRGTLSGGHRSGVLDANLFTAQHDSLGDFQSFAGTVGAPMFRAASSGLSPKRAGARQNSPRRATSPPREFPQPWNEDSESFDESGAAVLELQLGKSALRSEGRAGLGAQGAAHTALAPPARSPQPLPSAPAGPASGASDLSVPALSTRDSVAGLDAATSAVAAAAVAATRGQALGDSRPPQADTTTGGRRPQEISVKDAYWFLDSLEAYHVSQLRPEERHELVQSQLRDKPKHRNAVLFFDDYDFLFQRRDQIHLNPGEFEQSSASDHRVFLLHESCRVVLQAFKMSLAHAPAKSCIWSAMMIRTAYLLQRSGVSEVRIEDHVQGVQHKEATLFVGDYHISRSNFTKLCRSLLRREIAAAEARVSREAMDQEFEGTEGTGASSRSPGHHASSSSSRGS